MFSLRKTTVAITEGVNDQEKVEGSVSKVGSRPTLSVHTGYVAKVNIWCPKVQEAAE